MTDSTSRLVGAFCVLVGVWIVVYWWWTPTGDAVKVSFAEPPELQDRQLVSRPRSVRTHEPTDRAGSSDIPPLVRDPLAAGGVIAPRFEDYTIREGDTYAKVAERRYGNADHWVAIAQANPLKDPRRIRPGDVIRLPADPLNVQGLATDGSPEPVAPRAEPQTLTYTVRSGDTLGGISESFYGTARHADLIYEANRDLLRDVDDIRAGEQLKIPPPPASRG